MPNYRVFRLKDNLRANFRQLPHLSGVVQLKPKDYFEDSAITAAGNRYAAWQTLRLSEEPLEVGDALLEDESKLYIAKFVGLEPAEWVLPESHPASAKPAPELAVS